MGKDLWFHSRMLPFLWQGVSALWWASQRGGDFTQFTVCAFLTIQCVVWESCRSVHAAWRSIGVCVVAKGL